jgi:hypothetical protein
MQDVRVQQAKKSVQERVAVGGIDRFLYYCSSDERWCVSDRESMEAGNGEGYILVESTVTTPE